jgi:hypothetical protein
MIPCFFHERSIFLVAAISRARMSTGRVSADYDVVDERSPRRDVGIDELAKLLDLSRALRLRIGGGG